jgi:hypothetical protein
VRLAGKMTKHLEVSFDINGATGRATIQVDRNGATITLERGLTAFVGKRAVEEFISKWDEAQTLARGDL